METETIRKIDHWFNIGPVIVFYNNNNNRSRDNSGIETPAIQTDRETFFSHHMETILNIQIHRVKTTEAVHQNISTPKKDKYIKYKQQKKHIQKLRYGKLGPAVKSHTL